ncbi:hypothetical protein BZG36_02072 [Bifiguratus adelaidae]|uniref:Major facilitator superfamily (MFS) profile domain-containing protein n=1 Tax=Bifiguratus adelaidae TaxID=1938954 RepID=A0A261Y3J3_9FUNG|nr:hypothetical protein BZG36_02072 [Bifiguratus adelaidae]
MSEAGTKDASVFLGEVEIIPGTEIMSDEIAHKHFKHARGKGEVLIPQPTNEQHDPLNWNRRWKLVITVVQAAFVLISVMTNLSIAPLTPVYMNQWGKSEQEVALLTGATVITLGYANFVIVPCAEIFGRRITSIVCGLICLGSNIWQASAVTYESFLAARVISGLGAAANESMMPMVVADIFFLHERGQYMALYFMYFGGTMVGPLISGNIAAHITWRWFFWVCTIAQGLNVFSMFFFPETRFKRDETPKLAIEENSGSSVAEEKAETGTVSHVEVAEDARNQSVADTESATDHLVPETGRPRKAQFNVIKPLDVEVMQTLFRHVYTPVQLFFFPIVLWAAMTMGGGANALLDVNLLQSQALSAPPYNSTLVRPLSDWIAAWLTKRNKGIREPEMRLWSLIPYLILTVIAMTVVGVGFQQGWVWEVIIVIGFTLVSIMVISTVVKNTFGFGMTYFVNPWVKQSGFVPPAMLLMAIPVGFGLIGMIVLLVYGKELRALTRNAKVHSF